MHGGILVGFVTFVLRRRSPQNPTQIATCFSELQEEGDASFPEQDDITALGGVLEYFMFQNLKSLRRHASRDSGLAEFFTERQFRSTEARAVAALLRVAAFKYSFKISSIDVE